MEGRGEVSTSNGKERRLDKEGTVNRQVKNDFFVGETMGKRLIHYSNK